MRQQQRSDDGYFTKRETAEHLCVSLRTIDNLVGRGDLIAFRIGRKLLFRKSEVDAFVESRRIVRRGEHATLSRVN